MAGVSFKNFKNDLYTTEVTTNYGIIQPKIKIKRLIKWGIVKRKGLKGSYRYNLIINDDTIPFFLDLKKLASVKELFFLITSRKKRRTN